MNAEQYRALVQKLEAIQEAETTEPPNMAAGMDTTAPAADPNAPATAPTVTTPATGTTTEIPTIDAPTFSQAYAQAAKQGLKKFKWCGTYAVKAKPVMPQPVIKPKVKPPEQKVDFVNQSTPLGGTMSNPMSFAPNSGFGA
jgi:hypothetical protein